MKYCIARELIRTYRSQRPQSIYEWLDRQSYWTNRPLLVKLYDVSLLIVGRQTFANKVAIISRDVSCDWYFSLDAIKINLKSCLFKYPSVLCAFSVPGELYNQIKQHRQLRKKASTIAKILDDEEWINMETKLTLIG